MKKIFTKPEMENILLNEIDTIIASTGNDPVVNPDW